MSSEVSAVEVRTAPPPSSAYSWYVVLILTLAYTVSYVDRQILSLMVGPIRADLNLTDTEMSLLHGMAFALFYTFMGIFLGWAADRWNRRNLIMGGMGVWGLATAACGLAGSFGTLFAARTVVGVGEAALSPAAYSMISDYFAKSRRGRALGIYSAGIFVGSGFAYIVGGGAVGLADGLVENLADMGYHFRGWQVVFVLVSLPAVLLLFLMRTVKEPARQEQGAVSDDALADFKAGMRSIWARRGLYLPIILAFSFTAVVNYAFFAWIPSYFIRVFEWTPKEIGLSFGVILLVFGTSGMWISGYLSDKMVANGKASGPLTIALVGAVLGVIPAATFTFFNDPYIALVCLVGYVFCFSFTAALGPVALQAITPNELRGQVSAFYLFILNIIALGLGPTAVALTSDYIFEDEMKIGLAMSVVAVVVVPIAVVLFLIGRRRMEAESRGEF